MSLSSMSLSSMPTHRLLVLTIVLLGFAAPLFAQCEVELTPAGGWVANSVELSDDVAIVGASQSASIFRYDGVDWTEEAQLIPSDLMAGDSFGSAVAIDGEVAVVGAAQNDEFGDTAGAAYVFRFNGASWQQSQKLAVGGTFTRFGRSVDISGDRIIVGARDTDLMTPHVGVAYVYSFDGSLWNLEQELRGSDGALSGTFGESVSLLGDTAVVGAPNSTGLVGGSGSVYVYRFDGSTWVEVDKLFDLNGSGGDRFGDCVDLSEERLIVGVRADDDAANNAGSAFLFRSVAGVWLEEEKFLPSFPRSSQGFGRFASVDGEVVCIGSSLGRTAEIWRFDGVQWNSDGLFFADATEKFGACDVDGDRMLQKGSLDSAYLYSYQSGSWSFTGISEHPSLQAVCPGEQVTLSVTVVGEGPFFYQWERSVSGADPEDIVGANDSTLVFDPLNIDDLRSYRVIVTTPCGVRLSDWARLECQLFVRGDVNGDGIVNTLTDGLHLLNGAFASGAQPPCLASSDVDGNGNVNGLLDGLYLLNWGFASGAPIPAPFPECGTSPAAFLIGCQISACL